MIKYRVNQKDVQEPLLRTGSSLIVYDERGKSYIIRLNKNGNIHITTLEGGDLVILPQYCNALTIDTDE